MSRGKFWLAIFLCLPGMVSASQALDAVVSEIAWMGSAQAKSPAHEWIEIYNNTANDIVLNGWQLAAQDGAPKIQLKGVIPARSFFLLERTSDETLPELVASQIYKGALENAGENLKLIDLTGQIVDELPFDQGWPQGKSSTGQTMERKDSQRPGQDKDNWQTSQSPGGTPLETNSLPSPKPLPPTAAIEESPVPRDLTAGLVSGTYFRENDRGGSSFVQTAGLALFISLLSTLAIVFYNKQLSIFLKSCRDTRTPKTSPTRKRRPIKNAARPFPKWSG